MDFTKTIIPLALMASESIAHEADIDSEPIRARGIIVKYKPYRYVLPHRVGFCAVLACKRVDTLPILVWNWVWFSRDLRECMKSTYLSFQFQVSEKE